MGTWLQQCKLGVQVEGLHKQLDPPDQSLKVLASRTNSGVIRTYELLPGDRIKPLRAYTDRKAV